MKLGRHGRAGEERPSVVDPVGRLRDLSDHCADIGRA